MFSGGMSILALVILDSFSICLPLIKASKPKWSEIAVNGHCDVWNVYEYIVDRGLRCSCQSRWRFGQKLLFNASKFKSLTSSLSSWWLVRYVSKASSLKKESSSYPLWDLEIPTVVFYLWTFTLNPTTSKSFSYFSLFIHFEILTFLFTKWRHPIFHLDFSNDLEDSEVLISLICTTVGKVKQIGYPILHYEYEYHCFYYHYIKLKVQ